MKYHVERSVFIKADRDRVWDLIGDFRHWNNWSPWTIMEPECRVDIEGEAGEIGHKMSWDGKLIGAGTNEIESVGDGMINYDLRFIKPFKSQAKTSFEVEQVDGGVNVTWTMDSSMPFFLFFMVKMMKNWIGMDYERGLKMLKELAEKGRIDAKTTNEGVKDFQGFSYVGLQQTCAFDELCDYVPKDFERLITEIVKEKGKSAKHWVCLYPKIDMRNMMFTYIAAVSDEDLKDVELGDDYVRGEIGSGKVLEIKHRGSHDLLGNAWSMGIMYLRAKKMKQKGFPFDYYWNSPYEVKPNELETSVYFPLKG